MSLGDTMHEQAAAYALGALDAADVRAFEAQLAASAELRSLVREYREVAGAIAVAEGGPAPSPSLRGRVLDRVRQEQRARPWAPRRLWTALALAASIGGIAVAGVQTSRLSARQRELRSLQAELSGVTTRRDLLQRRLDAILDDNTRMYDIRPAGQGGPVPGFGAQVFWRRDTQTWLVHAYNMPHLPEGQVYQLWYVTPTERISAGVLALDEEGHGIEVLDVPPGARAATLAAVSIEPGPSGSAQPTGAIVMAGTVQ